MIRPVRRLLLVACVLLVVTIALPTAAAEYVIFEPGDVPVSPAYPLNVNPPRPVLTPPEAVPGDLNAAAYLVVNTDNLHVRQGSAPEYAPVAIVDGGTSLIPLGWNGDPTDAWWYVQVGGVRGWVKGEFVVVRGNAAGLPVVESQGERTIPRFYTGGENFVRTAPLYERNYICLLPGNLEYEVIGQTVGGSWYEVRGACDDGRVVEGWLPAANGFFRNPGAVDVPVTWQ